jgi:hypothetical protein
MLFEPFDEKELYSMLKKYLTRRKPVFRMAILYSEQIFPDSWYKMYKCVDRSVPSHYEYVQCNDPAPFLDACRGTVMQWKNSFRDTTA